MGVRISISFLGKKRRIGGSGQILVEYGLLLLLIAIVVLALVTGVGRTTNNTYSTINSRVSSAMQ